MRARHLLLITTAALVAAVAVPLTGQQAPAQPQGGGGQAPAAGQGGGGGQAPAQPTQNGWPGQPGPAFVPVPPPPGGEVLEVIGRPSPTQVIRAGGERFAGVELAPPAQKVPVGFTPIFNGVNLSGWHTSRSNIHGTTPNYYVMHGMIIGTQSPLGSGGLLITDKKYRNFELVMDVKPDWGCDSGLFFRTTETGVAYQVSLDYLPTGMLGNVNGENGLAGVGGARGRAAGAPAAGGAPAAAAPAAGGRGAGGGAPAAAGAAPAAPAAGGGRGAGGAAAAGGGRGAGGAAPAAGGGAAPAAAAPANGMRGGLFDDIKAWKREDWNTIRIRVEGDVPHVMMWVNETLITDFTDAANNAVDGMVEGPLALQVHGLLRWRPGGFWRWKNIGIKEL